VRQARATTLDEVTRTTFYTAASLDGFLADPDNSLTWLVTRDIDRSGPMGYDVFIASVGALVMGATTYEWLLDHLDHDEHGALKWPYEQPTWVVTHRDPAIVPGADLRFYSGDVALLYDEMMAAADGKGLWVVGGGDLAGQFADADLLDEVIVSFAPVTLGAGAPLMPRRLELRLEEVARNGDFACARYAVVGETPKE
jgi:dihydrofolate reductase